jgi:hypothetical protein
MIQITYKQIDVNKIKYHDFDNKKFIGVTSILDILDDPIFIKVWKTKTTQEEIDKVLTLARNRGNYVHLQAEHYWNNNILLSTELLAQISKDLNVEVPIIDSKIETYLQGFNTFIATYDSMIKPIKVENRLYDYENLITGKPDLVCEWDGILTLVDYKSSSKAKLDKDTLLRSWLQTSAYVSMWNYKYPLKQIKQIKLVCFTYGRKNGLGEIETLEEPMILEYISIFKNILSVFTKSLLVVSNNG